MNFHDIRRNILLGLACGACLWLGCAGFPFFHDPGGADGAGDAVVTSVEAAVAGSENRFISTYTFPEAGGLDILRCDKDRKKLKDLVARATGVFKDQAGDELKKLADSMASPGEVKAGVLCAVKAVDNRATVDIQWAGAGTIKATLQRTGEAMWLIESYDIGE